MGNIFVPEVSDRPERQWNVMKYRPHTIPENHHG
jgi:hypothetical protein